MKPTYKTACAGHKILISNFINFLLLFHFTVLPAYANTEQYVVLHSPTEKEKKELKDLFSQESSLYGEFEKKSDFGFTFDEVLVSKIKLDHDKKKLEIVVRVNHAGFDGTVGDGFFIWKKINSKWIEISDDDFIQGYSIILENKYVNGFRIYRVKNSPYDRIYDGKIYTCPTCPQTP